MRTNMLSVKLLVLVFAALIPLQAGAGKVSTETVTPSIFECDLGLNTSYAIRERVSTARTFTVRTTDVTCQAAERAFPKGSGYTNLSLGGMAPAIPAASVDAAASACMQTLRFVADHPTNTRARIIFEAEPGRLSVVRQWSDLVQSYTVSGATSIS